MVAVFQLGPEKYGARRLMTGNRLAMIEAFDDAIRCQEQGAEFWPLRYAKDVFAGSLKAGF